MIAAEWKALFTKRFLLVSIIFVSFIPMFYAMIFLASMWDPYNHLNQLPVAIVNEDKAVKFDGKTLDIGTSLVKQMKKTKTLDYHFVSEKSGIDGLRKGSYYMVLKISKQFSASAETLLTNHPKMMQIDYQTSQGRSMTATSVANGTVTALKEKVAKEITALYTQELLNQFADVGKGMTRAANGSNKLLNGSQRLLNGTAQLSQGTGQFSKGLTDYLKNESKISNGTSELTQGLQKLTGAIPNGNVQIDELTTNLPKLQSAINQLDSQVNQAVTLSQPELTRTLSEIENLKSELQSLEPLLSQADNNTISQEISTLVNQQIKTTDAYKNSSSSNQQSLLQAADSAVSSEVSQLNFSSYATKLTTLIGQISSFEAVIKNAQNELVNLQTNVTKLNQANNILVSGAVTAIKKQQTGLLQIKSVLNNQIIPGSQKLTVASQTLTAQNGKLERAVGKISTAEDSLYLGATKMNAGADKLHKNLAHGSQELSMISTKRKNSQAITTPVAVNHKDVSNVPNNGTAAAPYMMSVALFVGAISLNTIFDFFGPKKRPTSGLAWWASKASVLYTLSFLQAVVMFAALAFINGLSSSNALSTLVALVAEAFAYMSIVAFFSATLKKFSPVVILTFMVIQLSSSAGLFPIQLSGKFFQFFNPYVPMTYGIEALRETVSIGSSATQNVLILLGITVFFTVLTIVYFSFAKRKNHYEIVS
ncbi:YhgE/Pip family protein [Lactococcus nasutitermitis]|uniref:YhgE/Pip family protein n=1 Tax=Lactococcus nasutitermitis TaxID=1652957 RepID=A0ABV9JGT1_9LACT|nr:YhgE/Pip domain-containing protein [Lactococcus nasutitermitis]